MKSNKYNFLIFLINPFVGAINYLFSFKKNRDYSIVWLLFSFLFGFFFISNEGSDYYTYLQRFEMVSNFNLNEFISFLKNQIDYISWIILYVFSLTKISFNFIWGILSLIYGFIILKIINNLKTFVEVKKIQETNFFKIVLLTFIFAISLYLLYNFRFWFGAFFIILGFTYFLLGNDKKMLLCLVFALFFHFALLPLVILFLIVRYIRINVNILAVICIVTIFSDFTEIIIRNTNLFFADQLGNRINYIGENYNELYKNNLRNLNFYVFGAQKLLYYTILFFMFINFKKINLKSKFEKIFLSIFFIFFSYVNLIITMPLSDRFERIAIGIGLLTILLIPFKSKPKYNILLYVACLFFIVVEFRKYIDFLNVGLFMPTGLASFFYEESAFMFFLR